MKNLILTEFGAPSTPDELREFLTNLNNRNPSREELGEATRKYNVIGGSPIREKLIKIAEGIKGKLDGVRVDYAFLYNKPYLKDVIELNAEYGDITILPMFTFYSRKTAMDISRSISGYTGSAKIKVAPEASRISCMHAVWGKKLKSDTANLKKYTLVFTAHSIPASGSGEYLQSFRKFAENIASYAGKADFLTGFQNSRPGWIGPHIYELQLGTCKDVVVVPLSFLLTNMEILYDLDHEFSEYIVKKGYRYMRSGPPDESDQLYECLAGVV
ncbi:MAG: ferrochelatase [Nitrososphaeria archaeon]